MQSPTGQTPEQVPRWMQCSGSAPSGTLMIFSLKLLMRPISNLIVRWLTIITASPIVRAVWSNRSDIRSVFHPLHEAKRKAPHSLPKLLHYLSNKLDARAKEIKMHSRLYSAPMKGVVTATDQRRQARDQESHDAPRLTVRPNAPPESESAATPFGSHGAPAARGPLRNQGPPLES